MEIAFGPVPSRRLGRSLGINHVPFKHCSYACIYCQLGPTPKQETVPHTFHLPETIRHQVILRMEALRNHRAAIDYLTFVPDGEPTLDANLGASINRLRDLGLPIAVISNASLIWRADVREALNQADWVCLKVDSVHEGIWRRINRPHETLDLESILDGILLFAANYSGFLATETMLVAGINDSPDDIRDLAGFLGKVRPRRSYLAVPHRPPAEKGVHGPDEASVTRAHEILTGHGLDVELLTAYEGDEFVAGNDVLTDVLAVTAVHPMRESALVGLLDRAGSKLSAIQPLLDNGALRRVNHAGETFYIHRLTE